MRSAVLPRMMLPFLLCVGSRSLAQPLMAHAGADVTICSNGQTTLGATPAATGGTGPYQYSWSPAAGLSDPNIAHPVCTVNSTTVYTLTVTDSNAPPNSTTDQVTVTVVAAPTVSLSSPNAEQTTTYNGDLTFSICEPGFNSYAFQFADASTAQAGATYSITWGNGNTGSPTASGWTDTQTFPLGLTQGTYTIHDPGANGCVTTVPFYVFIGDVPLGGLSVITGTSICTGQTITFAWNNIATNPPGTSYIVDYGDGVIDTMAHPPPAQFSHTYTISSCTQGGGEFSVNWRITNPCDTRTGQLNQIRVSESPQASFTISPNDTACVNTTVTFTDASLGQQAPNCNNPKHIWSISPGTYTVTSGTLGNTAGQPNNPALWATGSTTLGVQFTAPGTYTISDATGNVCGLDTLTHTICVEPPPVPAFTITPNTGCVPLVGQTDNTSTSANSCSIHYQWQVNFQSSICGSVGASAFTGGTNSSSFEPQITFSAAGTYQVRLSAINSCGTFNATQPVTVNAPPQVSIYTVGPICAGQSIFPVGSFQACGSPITGYSWSSGGGNPAGANTQSPGQFTYPTAGNYSVTATANSACGNTMAAAPLLVNVVPGSASASVVNDTICAGGNIQLQAAAIAGATYQWTGPNGFSSSQQNPVVVNPAPSALLTYTVTAYIGTCAGPASSVNVTVLPAPILTITPGSPSLCAGASVTLTANGGSGYTWTANGNPAGAGVSITVSPTTTTTYSVAGSGQGCAGNTSTTVTVYQPTNVTTTPTVVECDQAIADQLSANPAGGVWSGADLVNLTAGGQVTPVPGALGNDTLTYTYTNAQGCVTVAHTVVTIQAVSNPANAGADMQVCQNTPPVALNGTPAGGTWSGTNVTGSSFDPVTSGTFNLTYSTGTGSCATQDVMVMTVVSTPAVTAGPDISVCQNADPFALNAANPPGGTWSGTGVIGSGPYDFDPSIAAPNNVLTYTWSDGNGCSNSDQITASVVPPPVANAGPDTTLCDQSIAYPMTASPAGGVWTGPAPFFSTNPATFTPQPGVWGSWSLLYVYTDPSGCVDSSTVTVTVQALTNIASAGNDTAVCANGGAVQLNGQPGGGSWTSTPYLTSGGAFDPAAAGTGAHAITFCVGGGTCLSCDQRTVTVVDPPPVNAGADLGFCSYEPVQDLFEAPAGGTWSGSPGLIDASQGLFDPGLATTGANQLTYTYTDPNTNCTNSDDAVITVNGPPTAGFTNPPIACQGAPFSPTDLSSNNLTWQWDFGDNTGTDGSPFPQHIYAATGTYTITLIVGTGAGCTDTTTSTVTVWPAPVVDFLVDPAEGCGPLMVSFTNNSTGPGVTYAWDFGYGAGSNLQYPPSVTYPAGIVGDTSYTVQLTASNQCGTYSGQAEIVVHPTPTALFGPDFDSGCSPWPVTFSNVSVGLADQYQWLWGDGTSTYSTDTILHHTYTTDSVSIVRTVTLIATNACGSDTATYDILVQPNTITAFFNTDTTEGCAPLTVQFTQYSIGVTHWHWNFDGVNVSTAHDAAFTYTQAGTYTATLFGDNGCSYDTVSVTITVLPSPDVQFGVVPDSVCAGVPFQFINQTADYAGLQWDFGDNSGSTLTDPVHTYAQSGNYPVTLTVQSSLDQCSGSLTRTINVKVTPVAGFFEDPNSGCKPLPVQFYNTSTGADFAQWDFGDQNTSGTISPLHTYADAGTYTVQLIAENLNGCADTTHGTVVVFPIPTSGFTLAPPQSCFSPVQVQFTNASQGALTYQWTFGNGQGSPDVDPFTTYAGANTYAIQLVAWNQYGCSDTSHATFTVFPTPLADFNVEPDPGCATYPVQFTNTSQNSNAWLWDLGDLSTASDEDPQHTYPLPGIYTVQLIAYGAGGCTDTLLRPAAVIIYPTPVADFVWDTLMSVDNALQFTNLSEQAERWWWDFGDGSHTTERDPVHYFPNGPGNNYKVCLVAINSYDCPDTLCKWISAPSDPELFAPNAFTPNGDGLNEIFLPVVDGYSTCTYAFYVFDRWGERIFTADRPGIPWDGTYNGEPCKQDVYVWRVVFKNCTNPYERNKERSFIGHVTLLRGQ